MLFGSSSFLTMVGYFIPLFYLPDLAVSRGVERAAANFLLSICGKKVLTWLQVPNFLKWVKTSKWILIAAISNIIGKLVTGWLCDLSCINTFLVSNIYIFLSGISACLLPFCNSYELYAFVVSLYGFFTVIYTLEPCILVELIGLNNLTSAYGLLLFFQVCSINYILLFSPYSDQRCIGFSNLGGQAVMYWA